MRRCMDPKNTEMEKQTVNRGRERREERQADIDGQRDGQRKNFIEQKLQSRNYSRVIDAMHRRTV